MGRLNPQPKRTWREALAALDPEFAVRETARVNELEEERLDMIAWRRLKKRRLDILGQDR